MPSGFIDDGYTQEFVIPGLEDEFDPVTIVCRPLIRREHWAFSREIASLRGKSEESESLQIVDQIDELRAKTVSEHLLSWDLTTQAGKPVEVSPENLLRCNPRLFDRVTSRVLAFPDPDEETEDDKAAKN